MKPEIYRQLAATGRYYNTGKVLIGLLREPPQRKMHADACRVQDILLDRKLPWRALDLPILFYLLCFVLLLTAVIEIVS